MAAREGNYGKAEFTACTGLGDQTKKPLPIAVLAVAMNSNTGGELKLKNSLIRITACEFLKLSVNCF